jgi:hypothetical protein
MARSLIVERFVTYCVANFQTLQSHALRFLSDGDGIGDALQRHAAEANEAIRMLLYNLLNRFVLLSRKCAATAASSPINNRIGDGDIACISMSNSSSALIRASGIISSGAKPGTKTNLRCDRQFAVLQYQLRRAAFVLARMLQRFDGEKWE